MVCAKIALDILPVINNTCPSLAVLIVTASALRVYAHLKDNAFLRQSKYSSAQHNIALLELAYMDLFWFSHNCFKDNVLSIERIVLA